MLIACEVTKLRPAEFKWRQFEPQLILMAVGFVPALFTFVSERVFPFGSSIGAFILIASSYVTVAALILGEGLHHARGSTDLRAGNDCRH